MTEKKDRALTIDDQAVYRIRVQGRLDSQWADRIEGINITENFAPGGRTEAVLVGRVHNQAALAGVMNTLYELHLPVLSVDCLEKG